MRTITLLQRELIDAVVVNSGIDPALLEKDVHVTDALHAIFGMAFPHSRFVFCGGTCLAKAYGFIERMSEDVDLKIAMTPGHDLSRNATRNYLRDLTKQVKEKMMLLGFVEDLSRCRVMNEHRYTTSSWRYQPAYASIAALRPYLCLECIVRTPKIATNVAEISYLMDRLGAPVTVIKQVECVAAEETVAEKVLSFLRRHAMHRAGFMTQAWDETLVRHIYDTYCVLQLDPAIARRASQHFAALVELDRTEFQDHEAFVTDAKSCLERSLLMAEHEEQTFREYNSRLIPLIYGAVRPEFASAFSAFKQAGAMFLDTL